MTKPRPVAPIAAAITIAAVTMRAPRNLARSVGCLSLCEAVKVSIAALAA